MPREGRQQRRGDHARLLAWDLCAVPGQVVDGQSHLDGPGGAPPPGMLGLEPAPAWRAMQPAPAIAASEQDAIKVRNDMPRMIARRARQMTRAMLTTSRQGVPTTAPIANPTVQAGSRAEPSSGSDEAPVRPISPSASTKLRSDER